MHFSNFANNVTSLLSQPSRFLRGRSLGRWRGEEAWLNTGNAESSGALARAHPPDATTSSHARAGVCNASAKASGNSIFRGRPDAGQVKSHYCVAREGLGGRRHARAVDGVTTRHGPAISAGADRKSSFWSRRSWRRRRRTRSERAREENSSYRNKCRGERERVSDSRHKVYRCEDVSFALVVFSWKSCVYV